MIPINYHHLYYFWTVARLGSISAATRKLYLSQPTLSGQLKELEASFGAKLLARGRKGVTLTPEGRAVFERCEKIFAEGEDLAAFVQNGFRTPHIVRLGLRPTVTREVVLRMLDFARDLDRSCRVAVFSGEAESLLWRLRQGSIDVIVANQDLSAGARDLRGRLVSRLPVYFVANRAVRRQVRRFPADLARTALLLRPEGTPVRQQVDAFLSKRRISCDVEADSDDVDLIRRLALEGRGVAALSGLAVAPELKAGRLSALHAAPIGLWEPIWLACRAQPAANPALRRMIEGLMDRFTVFGQAPAVRSRLGA